MSEPVMDVESLQVIHISLVNTDWRLITSRDELVLPNGIIETVTSQDKDLWFGLRVRD